MATLGFALFGSNQLESADFVLSHVRKHYPDNYIMIISDKGEDYTELSKKYNTEYFYSKTKIGYPQQPFGYKSPSVMEFLERFYLACIRSKCTHIMYLEEDVVIFKPLQIDDDLEIQGYKVAYPDGTPFENGFPDQLMKMIERFCEVKPNVTSYGCQGGAVFKVSTFIENYSRIMKFFEENLPFIQDNVYHTAGWIDCFFTLYYLLCGKSYKHNTNYIEVDSNYELKDTPEWAELAHNYKWFYDTDKSWYKIIRNSLKEVE